MDADRPRTPEPGQALFLPADVAATFDLVGDHVGVILAGNGRLLIAAGKQAFAVTLDAEQLQVLSVATGGIAAEQCRASDGAADALADFLRRKAVGHA